MNITDQLIAALSIIFVIGIILGLFLTALFYIGDWLNETNSIAEEERKRLAHAEMHDAKVMEQAKKHTIQYTEKDLRDIKDSEFNFDDIKLEINVKNSTVKTEVVYAN